MEDSDFLFPKRESKLDMVLIEWNNLTNHKKKNCYFNELEEVIKDFEGEIDSKNKEVKNFSIKENNLTVPIIILILVLLGIFFLK